MGGYGSTRWYSHTKKHTTDHFYQWRIQNVAKTVLARAYTTTARLQSVALDRIPMRYGGHRYYFKCPKCGRRCEIVYYPDRWFNRVACRRCHDLTYKSSQEAHQLDRGLLGEYGRKIDRLFRLEKVQAKLARCRYGSKNWQRLTRRARELEKGL